MSSWLWLAFGLSGGAIPSLAAEGRYRPWWARRWWRLSLGIALVTSLPFGIVLVMLLSDSDFEAIRELGAFFVSPEFSWFTALSLGWLTGSGVMAWIHRKAEPLQGPPLSPEVATLASDPEKTHEAIQRYRQETGADLPVATDVVEAYSASQSGPSGQPARPGLGPVDWMHVGFTVSWYVVLGIGFGLSLGSRTNHGQSNPFIVALAFFLFIPSLFAGFCGVCGGVVSDHTKAALRKALEGRSLTRRFAFMAGLVAGSVSIAGVLAVGVTAYSLSQTEASVGIALVGIAGVLIASPFLGLWLLKKRSSLETHA